MDIICPKCAEPWDHDEIHERAAELRTATYRQVRDDFYVNGCSAFGGSPCAPASASQRTRAEIASTLYGVFGDDLDGCASDMEDFTRMGLM